MTRIIDITRVPFHKHFMSSFYARRSQKHQKTSQVNQLFVLLGSVRVEAAHNHGDKIDRLVNLLSRSRRN